MHTGISHGPVGSFELQGLVTQRTSLYVGGWRVGDHKCVLESGMVKLQQQSEKSQLFGVFCRHAVNRIGISVKKVVRGFLHYVTPRAIDFDWLEQKLYWSSVENGRSVIKRSSFKKSFVMIAGGGSNHSTDIVLKNVGGAVEGLAVDWLARNIYWCNRG